MDFELTEEQKMFQTMVRDFVSKEIEPYAAEWDETEKFPYETVKKMADIGLCGLHMPEEYGGSGDEITFVIACEEISRGSAGLASSYITSLSLGMYPIIMHGNKEQKNRYIPRVINGATVAFGLTEAMAGSDVAALETKYTQDGDYYVLNGNKTFITNGAEADFVTTYATKDKSLGYRGISAFVVDKGTMATDIDAARLLTYRGAWLTQQTGKAAMKEPAMAKLFATEAAHRVCHKAVQIFGGYGYTKDFAVERYYRDQRITEIYEGTSEMQRMTIARQVTGMK